MAKAKVVEVKEKRKSRGPQGEHAKKPKDQLAKEIKGLLTSLEKSDDTDDKKKIRRQLRARGHYGGLGEPRGVHAVAKPARRERAKAAKTVKETPAPVTTTVAE